MKLSATLDRAKEIVDEAVRLAPAQRTTFLQDSCEADTELLAAASTLLSVHEQAENSNEALTIPLATQTLLMERVINHYKVKERLGRGGMGEVYKAIDTKLGRTVAIKTLSPELVDKPTARQRFFREARAASILSHPSICTVYEVGQHEDTVFIAMQFIQGETLSRLISQKGLSIETALAYALDVADALHEAHQHEIIHRDIKPANVIVNERNVAVVLDFGLAKQIHSEARSDSETPALEDVTTHLGIIGTIPYMSPEQARSAPLDARSDIFSFGILLYEMLTGTRPFNGRDDIDTLHLILYDEPLLASEINPQVDLELASIIKKSLAKEPVDRYQTLAELKQDLINIIHQKHYVVRGISTARSGEICTVGNQGVATSPNNLVATNEITSASPTQDNLATSWRSSFFSLRYVLGILLALAVAFGVWQFTRTTQVEVPPIASLKTSEVVSWSATPGEVYSIGAFSPDSKRIAYSSTESGVKSIWVKQTASGNPVQITTDEFKNDNPIWSPDGEEVAFVSLRGNHPGIWRIPYFGGTPTEIKPLQNSEGDVNLRHWSKNNKLYYQLKNNLFALDVTSREAKQITNFEASKLKISQLNISPDEASIAYISIDEKGNHNLNVISTHGGSATEVATNPVEIRNVVWHSDSNRILYSASVDGSYQMFVAGANGGQPAQITFGDKDALALDVAADGTKILFGSSKEESDVWGVNLANANEFALASDSTSELWPEVSPDGKKVIFQSIKNLSQGDKISSGALFIKPVTEAGQPLMLAAEGVLPQWSPDGKQLAFMRLTGNSYSLLTANAIGGGENQLLTGLESFENSVLPYNRVQTSYFSWSPDSRQIVYSSKRSGQANLWLVSANGTDDKQLTGNSDANLGISCPLWSADGKHIAYTTKPNKIVNGQLTYGVRIVDVETKQSKIVFQAEIFLRLLGWTQDGKGLLLAALPGKTATGSPTEITLMQVSVEQEAQRSIGKLQAAYYYNIHLSADGKTIAYAAHQEGKDNVWVIPSDGGLAKKITSNNDARLYFSSLAWSPDGKAIYFGKQSRYSLLSMLSNFK